MQYFTPTEHQVEPSSSGRIEKKLGTNAFFLPFLFFLSSWGVGGKQISDTDTELFQIQTWISRLRFCYISKQKENDQTSFPAGLEPSNFRVLGGRDNNYTTKTRHTTSNHVYCFFISSG